MTAPRTPLVLAIGTAVLSAAFTATAAAQPTPSSKPTSSLTASEIKQQRVIDDFIKAHPTDLAGLAAVVKQQTGQEMPVSVYGTKGQVSAATATARLPAVDGPRPSATSTKGGRTVQAAGLPVDTFTVAVSWIPVSSTRVRAHGVWNFKDAFIGGVAPYDLSSVGLQLGCSRILSTTTITYDWQNKQTANSASLRDSGLRTGAPISNVVDKTVNFAMLTDHGYTDVLVERPSGCASHQIGADYTYEHNQGGSIASVSAGWGFLNVTYGSRDIVLQKSTNPIYRTN